VIPFVEIVDNIGGISFAQIGAIALKLGTIVLTLMLNVVAAAQIPAVGVKVYIAEFKLLTVEGPQVPVIPLLEVVGKLGGVEPKQTSGIRSNEGIIFGVIVISKVVGNAH
jgi:hypothetical protein